MMGRMNPLESILDPLRGMTDGQLRPFAEACGISVHTVRNVLNGRTKYPRLDTYQQLAAVSQMVTRRARKAKAAA